MTLKPSINKSCDQSSGIYYIYNIDTHKKLTILVIAVMAGWGEEVFTAYSHWWLVPLLSSHFGAILGAGAYLLLVRKKCSKD